jgi:hypothetical protein
MGRKHDIVPRGPRYLVRRNRLEFLKGLLRQHGIKLCSKVELHTEDSLVVDATGTSGQIARRRGARRRAASTLLAIASLQAHLADGCTAIQSGHGGWWFAAGERGQATVMYLSNPESMSHRGAHGSAPDHPPAFTSLVGETRFTKTLSLASMSWLETASADNWFAAGESALALDPILGSGVEVSAQSAALLRNAVRAEDPHAFYNSSMHKLAAKHRILDIVCTDAQPPTIEAPSGRTSLGSDNRASANWHSRADPKCTDNLDDRTLCALTCGSLVLARDS